MLSCSYTAPSDAALEYDLTATKKVGFNAIRLHQKVNPERWYYHADRHGLVVLQDVPEKYGGRTLCGLEIGLLLLFRRSPILLAP